MSNYLLNVQMVASKLTPAMVSALGFLSMDYNERLDRERDEFPSPRTGTLAALIKRGLVNPGNAPENLLTDLGREVSRVLFARVEVISGDSVRYSGHVDYVMGLVARSETHRVRPTGDDVDYLHGVALDQNAQLDADAAHREVLRQRTLNAGPTARFYVHRSSDNAHTDEDVAMSSQTFGPFVGLAGAREGLFAALRAELNGYRAGRGPVAVGWTADRENRLGEIVRAFESNPLALSVESGGLRFTIRTNDLGATDAEIEYAIEEHLEQQAFTAELTAPYEGELNRTDADVSRDEQSIEHAQASSDRAYEDAQMYHGELVTRVELFDGVTGYLPVARDTFTPSRWRTDPADQSSAAIEAANVEQAAIERLGFDRNGVEVTVQDMDDAHQAAIEFVHNARHISMSASVDTQASTSRDIDTVAGTVLWGSDTVPTRRAIAVRERAVPREDLFALNKNVRDRDVSEVPANVQDAITATRRKAFAIAATNSDRLDSEWVAQFAVAALTAIDGLLGLLGLPTPFEAASGPASTQQDRQNYRVVKTHPNGNETILFSTYTLDRTEITDTVARLRQDDALTAFRVETKVSGDAHWATLAL